MYLRLTVLGAAVIWVASCLLLRKDNKTNEHNEGEIMKPFKISLFYFA